MNCNEILELKATLKSKGNEIVTLANDYEQIVHSKDVLLRQFDGALKQIKKKDEVNNAKPNDN